MRPLTCTLEGFSQVNRPCPLILSRPTLISYFSVFVQVVFGAALGQTIVKPTAIGTGANTDTKLLIYGLFQKGRVLAQDAVTFICD